MMSGLLNLTEDPQTLGLLSLGLRLMSNPSRRFGAALGQSGMGAIGDIQQAQAAQEQRRARALQEQLIRQQIEQGSLGLDATRREAELSRLPAQFIRPPMVAGADGTDAGAGMGGGEMDAGKMDLPGLRNAYLGAGALQRAAQVESFIPKAAKPEFKVVGDNLVRIDTQGSVAEAYRAPEKPAKVETSSLGQLLKEFAALPPDSPMRTVYLDAIKKATTHQPPMSVSTYGSPLPIELPGGGTGYIQPPTRPGGPTQVLTIPGTDKPAIKPAGPEKEPSEGERKAGTLLSRLRFSQQQLAAAITGDAAAASPNAGAEVTRRVLGDTAANIVNPAARQRVESAQLDILDAALTLGTGAAYTKEQLEGYRRSYFPQYGDDSKTIKDKQARLANVIKAAEVAAGRSAQKIAAPAEADADPLGLRK